ncbi:regulatory protein, luxR family [Streptomyces sp. TLI_053]|uniref:helix-turn-helix transcriptional regulator n=1 Tax=Streptomyces sp. TLI_053 TaxID=1855352 RepID=UPI00087C3A0C|nr:helix-turn-helix transcriptional regulator [Streptomyces sp. TLI_053]SDT83171.1 regulatory protein, luxR family [Streptomyces sp. TLI_053]
MANRRDIEREVLGAIAELSACRPSTGELFRGLHTLLAGPLGFDGGCWHGTDPLTGFPTSTVADGLDPGRFEQAVHLEMFGDDSTNFAAIRAAGHRVQTLDRATDGRPESSIRYRELLRPCGYGDELRINFDVGGGRWASAAFMREHRRGRFGPAEVRLAERIITPVGAALRDAHLRTLRRARSEPSGQSTDPSGQSGPPTVAILDARGRLRSADAGTRELIRRLAEPIAHVCAVPTCFLTVACRAAHDTGTSEVRMCTPDGQWFALHASPLDGGRGDVAVVISPASPLHRLPVAILAHGLSPRERQVALHALRGSSTKDIAALLHLTVPTVQQHVTAILHKTGVRNRRELVAVLTADHLPTLALPPGA